MEMMGVRIRLTFQRGQRPPKVSLLFHIVSVIAVAGLPSERSGPLPKPARTLLMIDDNETIYFV